MLCHVIAGPGKNKSFFDRIFYNHFKLRPGFELSSPSARDIYSTDWAKLQAEALKCNSL